MKWLEDEISDGLSAMLAAKLENAPALDTIEVTANVWGLAWARHVNSDQLDAPRVREAFIRYIATARDWPAPIRVIELMPPRPPLPRLPLPELTDEQRARNREKFDEIINMVTDKMNVRDPNDKRPRTRMENL